jgi:Xaa-Pro aminopeptidase
MKKLPQAILITKPENIFYFTGFKGSFAELIKAKKTNFLITDPRYKLQAQKMCHKDTEIIIISDYQKDLSKLFQKLGIEKLGFESLDFSYEKFLAYKKMFRTIKLVPLKNEVDLFRQVKTQAEIDLLKASQQLNEKVLQQVEKLIKIGVSEEEIAKKIISIGSSLGAEKVSFEPIVAFGKNSASPHYTPTNYKLKPGENVLIDMGFILNNYCSDMTRTFLPKNPAPEMQKMYELVLEAQENCLSKIKPGMSGIEADELSRSIFKRENLEEYFTHANGHGIGLEIHEAPSLSNKTKHLDRKILLEKNMVVTVEPGIYLENKFGIRIEDMVVLGHNKDNSALNLTEYPK